MEDKQKIEERLKQLEEAMAQADFWMDKGMAQETVKEFNELKEKLAGVGKYDKGNAIMTIFSGAGGDDAEDFSNMLLQMYFKYFGRQKWEYRLIHENKNDHGGYRNITIEILGNPTSHPLSLKATEGHGKASRGAGPYGTLKNESGVHRLVRISPFNAKKLRHTSFSMVEVIPDFEKIDEIDLPEQDIRVEFSKSSGPGGQNVNKRETAVRVIHIPTNIAVHVESERSQERNRNKAVQILKGKLLKRADDERKAKEKGMYVSKTTEIEWGNQIRSYVLHPYKMVKDHRTGVETANVSSVLEEGDLDEFIEAERGL